MHLNDFDIQGVETSIPLIQNYSETLKNTRTVNYQLTFLKEIWDMIEKLERRPNSTIEKKNKFLLLHAAM